jgi:hypothetical protein
MESPLVYSPKCLRACLAIGLLHTPECPQVNPHHYQTGSKEVLDGTY